MLHTHMCMHTHTDTNGTHIVISTGGDHSLLQEKLLRKYTPATVVKSCKCYAPKGHRNCGKICVNISCILVI